MHHKHFRVWKRQKRVLTLCRTSDAQQCVASDGLLASASLSSAVSSSPAAPFLLFHFRSSAFQVFASVKKLLILPACCPHCGLKDPVFLYLDIWLKCNFNRFPIMSAGNRLNLPVVSYSASSGSFSYSFGITWTIFPFYNSLTHFQHLLRYNLTSCVVFYHLFSLLLSSSLFLLTSLSSGFISFPFLHSVLDHFLFSFFFFFLCNLFLLILCREESFYCTVPITPVKREVEELSTIEEVSRAARVNTQACCVGIGIRAHLGSTSRKEIQQVHGVICCDRSYSVS